MASPPNLRGWGPGWPTRRHADMVWVQAAISGARWQMHRDLAPLWQFIIDEVERRGYLFDHGPEDTDDDWGYAFRPVRGTENRPAPTPSDHSYGTAGDIDAQEYPMGQIKRRPPQWVVDLFLFYGFEWGGGWKRPDPMHFEFAGSITEARFLIAALAAGHLVGEPAPLPATVPPPLPASPPAPQSEEDDDMSKLIRCNDPAHPEHGAVWAISGLTRTPVTAADYSRWLFLTGGEANQAQCDGPTFNFFMRNYQDISSFGAVAITVLYIRTIIDRVADKLGVPK